MKHIFEIKDLIATKESAEHIINSQVNVILKAVKDIDIAGINVFVNSINTEFYNEIQSDIPIKFIPTLRQGKKQAAKQTFAAFHNFIINAIAPHLNASDITVHIMDGTLDLTDANAEFEKYSTRLGEMITDVTEMMNLLNHPVWFNTASDKGNMKFGHYFTIIDFINIDETLHIDTFPECIMYAGNSNLDWIIVDCENYKKMKLPSLMMNSEYEYDFLSIKQLIAKFVDIDKGYFDTMFPTVPTEVGAYNRNIDFDKDLQKYDMKNYQENLKRYQTNIKEYTQLKPVNVNIVVEFVRNAILPKLNDSDKEKLEEFSKLLM